MTERGNDNATADVRPHAWTAAVLLALGAILRPFVPGSLVILTGGAILALEVTLLWYLPSFTKRAVVEPDWLALPGVILLVVASALALLSPPSAELFVTLACAHLAILLLASAAYGAPWRGGVPFWRAGAHQRGDLAAAIAMTIGLVAMIAAPVVGLGIVSLGVLTHFLPRSRGRAPIGPLVVGGAAIASIPSGPAWLAPAGLLVGALGAFAGPATKRAGPRLREAATPLAGAIAALIAALAIPGALFVAIGLALFAVSLLALPVVFNQKPARALILPATLAGIASLAPLPVIAPYLEALAILLALGALSPLRRPRRYCPPDPEAS